MPERATSGCTIPRFGMIPPTAVNVVLSVVRLSSRMLSPSGFVGGFSGRKMVLNPVPDHVPTIGASAPRSAVVGSAAGTALSPAF